MNQMTLPVKSGHGEILQLENHWQDLATVKTSVVSLPPQPSPPVSLLYRDHYERLKKYMGARLTAGYKVQHVLFFADEYARLLVGSATPDHLDVVATLVELASVELRIHPCTGGGFYAPPL